MAAHAQDVRLVFQAFILIFYQPLNLIMGASQRALQSLRGWLREQLQDESVRQGEGPIYYIIGALFYSILTIVFTLCDWGLIVLALEACGMEPPNFKVMDSSTLTATAFVTTALFWGSIFTDLKGWTHLGPWTKTLDSSQQKRYMIYSIVMLMLCASIGVSMALWRQDSLLQTMSPVSVASAFNTNANHLNEPQSSSLGGVELGGQMETTTPEVLTNTGVHTPVSYLGRLSDLIFLGAPAGIAFLCIVSSFFSGVGLAKLLKFLVLFATSCIGYAVLLPGYGISWLFTQVFNLLNNLIRTISDLFIRIGESILRLFGWRPNNGNTNAPFNGSGEAQPQGDSATPVNPAPAVVISENSAAETLPKPDSETNIAGHNFNPDRGFNPFHRRQG
jgi:hypothetical protein